MEISDKEADYLIRMKKRIAKDNLFLDRIVIKQKFPLNLRFELGSSEEAEFSFLWEISQSTKNKLRISLHFQENESKIGLFRVDYNSSHKNPETVTDKLPERFKPYIGKWFSNTEHHVHYYVEGYKPLVWALPIVFSEMTTKVLEVSDIDSKLGTIIAEFAKIINIETQIDYELV